MKKIIMLCLVVFISVMNFCDYTAVKADDIIQTAHLKEDYKMSDNISVTASTVYSNDYPITNIIDGNTSNCWISGYYPGGYNNFVMNLNETVYVTLIKFYNERNYTNERENLSIEISQDSSFTEYSTVYESTNAYPSGEWQTVEINSVVKYIRFRKNDAYSSQLSMGEVEIYTDNLIYEIASGATVSSSGSDQGTTPANVIDKNDSTYWSTSPVKGGAYWMADLGTDYLQYDIESIRVKLLNKDNDKYCQRKFVVEMANNADFSDRKIVYEHGNTLCVDELFIDMTDRVNRYRYIRIKKTCDDESLSIKYVKIFARAYMGENAAAHRRVYSNSTFMFSEYFNPKFAVDENFDETSAWCSNDYEFPSSPVFLVVDMGSVYSINTVLLKIQGLNGNDHLGGFTVTGSKKEDFSDAVLLFSQSEGVNSIGKKYLHFETDVPIRFIKIMSKSSNAMLGVTEIQAFTMDNIIDDDIDYMVNKNLASISNGASATAIYPWVSADYAIDGDYGTGYYNKYCGSNYPYIVIDFGEGIYDVEQVRVKMSDRDDVSLGAKNIKIELADEESFADSEQIYLNESKDGICGTEVINLADGAKIINESGTERIPIGKNGFRYLRIIRTVPDGNFRVWEVEAYGKERESLHWYNMMQKKDKSFVFDVDVSEINRGLSVIAVGYDHNRMVGCDKEEKDYKEQMLTFNIPYDGSIDIVKLFIWDMNRLTPLQNAQIVIRTEDNLE